MSPAQAILRGYNKDKVFSQQQAFKKRNGLKDDGSKAQWGMGAGTNRALQKSTKMVLVLLEVCGIVLKYLLVICLLLELL